jgi:hypothetical protein
MSPLAGLIETTAAAGSDVYPWSMIAWRAASWSSGWIVV